MDNNENDQSNIGYLINLLRSDGSIIINKRLAHNIGLNETIMFTELLAKFKYFADRKSLKDGYFFNTVADMQKDTSLSEFQQRKAIKNLIKLGLIRYDKRGLPAKRYFKIVEDEANIKKYLIEKEIKLTSSSEETKEQDMKNIKGNNTNLNDTNQNNTKVNVKGIKFSKENVYSTLSKNYIKKENLKKIDSILTILPETLQSNKEKYRNVLLYYPIFPK